MQHTYDRTMVQWNVWSWGVNKFRATRKWRFEFLCPSMWLIKWLNRGIHAESTHTRVCCSLLHPSALWLQSSLFTLAAKLLVQSTSVCWTFQMPYSLWQSCSLFTPPADFAVLFSSLATNPSLFSPPNCLCYSSIPCTSWNTVSALWNFIHCRIAVLPVSLLIVDTLLCFSATALLDSVTSSI